MYAIRSYYDHYLMSMATFSVMGSAIMTLGIRIVQERNHGWSTFMRVTPLPGAIYFLGKMFGQTIMHLTSIIFIFAAGYLINGVSLPALTWVYCGLWILIASLPFLALGTLRITSYNVCYTKLLRLRPALLFWTQPLEGPPYDNKIFDSVFIYL